MTTSTKAYVIGEFAIHDPAMYMEYVRAVEPMIGKHGGRYLVRGGEASLIEGREIEGRLLVFEFPSMAAVRAFYDDPGYLKVIRLRTESAASRIYAVEGYQP